METWKRFVEYAKIHSASAVDTECTPTTECQFELAHYLCREMKEIGLENVYETENAYVYGELAATEGYENKPCICFIAHIDTIPDFSGLNVKPQLIENYDGGAVKLGDSGRVLDPVQFPHLAQLVGHTLITTDGTTVLGADDKAGVAEIMTAVERVIEGKLPHAKISVCFTPDEEVGHGASLMDIPATGAEFGFTVDGGDLNELNFETFNAAAARVEVNGFNVHPGSSKNTMINASLVAMEINSMLPAGDTPAKTEDYEGFFHLGSMNGNVEYAVLDYIIRDHDAATFEARKKCLLHIEKLINEKYGEGTAKVTLREQYRNMAEVLEKKPEVVALAEKAIRMAGIEPVHCPVRGGTDGSQLSFRGLPCPNLGTGGYAFHGPYEHTTVQNLEKGTEIVLNIIKANIEG